MNIGLEFSYPKKTLFQGKPPKDYGFYDWFKM